MDGDRVTERDMTPLDESACALASTFGQFRVETRITSQSLPEWGSDQAAVQEMAQLI